MSKTVTQTLWYRVIIDDPRLAMPHDFYLLVETALRHVPSSVVMASRLEVVPTVATEKAIPSEFVEASPLDALRVFSESIAQLVWGRFFFFESKEEAEEAKISENELAANIARSQMTICIVDNTSCFVFTTSASLVCDLLANHRRLEVAKDDLSRILARQEEF